MSELRYHPFLGTWVITATHRQERTFHPPDDFCPLCPTRPFGFPTEIPEPDYDIAVFENRFPSLTTPSAEPAIEGLPLCPVLSSQGVCEVICYTSDHRATFADLSLSQVRKLTRVWRERFIDLSVRPGIEYVFVFENKGREIGVTLSHPHGQIYAFPFVPPVPARMLDQERRHFEATGRAMTDDWLNQELVSGSRVVVAGETFAAVVPFFARYPFEVHIVGRMGRRSLGEMEPSELDDLAEMLLDTVRRYDRLFGFSMPYIMAMFQSPVAGDHPYTRFRVEFYPPFRTADKLKYLAGVESAMGTFINDTLPEDSAKRLREA
ncbi:MAG TPA: galactose-1-phosphate uridylyltransferase [Fimbriimonadaceae bacterium]|nr:galactose-1-phosphate uridylyltransferase [Fimbriimonadaceae bacterium]HRJ96298.1 galactose-1-phosphate uridylyltransferase [Fimbriimonadaceae bacterium]